MFPKSVFLRQNPFDAKRTPGHLKFLRDLQSDQLHDFEHELSSVPESTLILSIENLFSDQPNHVLDKVSDYFKDWDVHIVVVLREQTAWLRSRYVENTMSGFSSRFEYSSTFVTAMIEQGTLNYNERLEFLRRRLNAQSIFAINFDSQEHALVPRFLNAIGVPVTDPDKAFEVHDNRREKPLFLVEAKRRLNVFVKGLHRDARLELEHALRERCKAMLAVGAPTNSITDLDLSIKVSERRKLERENSLLCRAGLIDFPLELEASPDALTTDIKSRISDAVDDLFCFGLDFASKLVDTEAKKPTAPLATLNWYSEVPLDWRKALFNEAVSVHVGSTETAILAACRERRIVRLLLQESREAYEIARNLDALPLPSPVMTVVVKDLENQTMQSMTQKYSFPAPDLLIMDTINDSPLTNSIRKEFVADSVLKSPAGRSPLTLHFRTSA